MAQNYLSIEQQVRDRLSQCLGVNLVKMKLNVYDNLMHEFDGVSPSGDILVEIKASNIPQKGQLRHTQLAEMSEACLLMLCVKSAKRRILAIADPSFYNKFINTMQAGAALTLGIEIILCNPNDACLC